MTYIITSKTRRHHDKKISEKYFRPGGVVALEKDGLSKFEAFREINRMTDKGVSVDERREIVQSFIDREKGK
jgi:hypothetical protein